MVKNLSANEGDIKDMDGFNSWVRKIPGRGHGNSLQYSCLENLMDKDWQATVRRVTKSWTQLNQLSTQQRTDNAKGSILLF